MGVNPCNIGGSVHVTRRKVETRKCQWSPGRQCPVAPPDAGRDEAGERWRPEGGEAGSCGLSLGTLKKSDSWRGGDWGSWTGGL